MSTPGSEGKISSRIMGLKFMQKHKAKEEAASKARVEAPKRLAAQWKAEPPAAAATANSGAASSSAPPAAAAPAPVPAAASASASTDARPPVRVIDDAAGELLASSSTLLDFRPARRSFGKFNPRLEKGLAEIESQKSALRERLAAEASAEATRAQREAAGQAASAARAEVQQAQTAADQEMAEHFSKYLPAPPEAAKPVKLREDPPSRSSGGGISMGGGKKRKARR